MERRRFKEEEIKFLQKVIKEKGSVILCKETDITTLAKKKKCWSQICEEFNAMPEFNKRTISQLMKCWDNVKTRRKKELAKIKRHRMSTGVGELFDIPPPREEMETFPFDKADIEVDSNPVLLTKRGIDANCSIQKDVLVARLNPLLIEEPDHEVLASAEAGRQREGEDEEDDQEEPDVEVEVEILEGRGSKRERKDAFPSTSSKGPENIKSNHPKDRAFQSVGQAVGETTRLTLYEYKIQKTKLEEANIRKRIAEEELHRAKEQTLHQRRRQQMEEDFLKEKMKLELDILKKRLNSEKNKLED